MDVEGLNVPKLCLDGVESNRTGASSGSRKIFMIRISIGMSIAVPSQEPTTKRKYGCRTDALRSLGRCPAALLLGENLRRWQVEGWPPDRGRLEAHRTRTHCAELHGPVDWLRANWRATLHEVRQ